MPTIFKADTPEQALHAVREWLRQRADQRAADITITDSGGKLLNAARVGALRQAAVDLERASTVPTTLEREPEVTLWNVVGTVHISDGFDITIGATSEKAARAKVIAMVEAGDYQQNPELQEVCINSVSPA